MLLISGLRKHKYCEEIHRSIIRHWQGDIKVASKFFEYVAKLRYFVARITNQNCGMKRLRAIEIQRICVTGIFHLPICCKVKACRTVIFPVVLYDCDTLVEDDRLRVSGVMC
jgi:hypothetical protein